MDIEAMKRYPLEDFLARLGHHPVQRRANAIWYRSPYREEHTPSFKVNPEKNLWFDFGEGKGGNIFALAGEFIQSGDFLTQARYVAEVADMPLQDYEQRRTPEVRQPAGHSFEDVEVLPLQSRALLHYLQERGIPSAIAIANCKEMRYSTHGKRYFAVAFGNCGGGYEIRNPFFKGCGRHPAAVRLCRLQRVRGLRGLPFRPCIRHRRRGGPPCPQLGVQCGEGVPASGRLRNGAVPP